MGRNFSPVLCQELANLEKDAESRKSAMRALNSYVEGLDTKSIPQFLAQVSETKDAGFSSMEYAISLYEVLARAHGPKIVPQIDNIMATVIKTLAISGGSFAPQQACSKVILAISRYAILPTTPDDKKTEIMHSLCKPLSEALLGTQESLSCGAALCLKAMVDSDNWRFASDEMVNVVCLRLAGALEDKLTQTNSHMGLVMSLAKHNSIVIEPYARLLIWSGLRILDSGDMSSPKRLTAIHMIGYLMKYLDIGSIFSELGPIIDEMEKLLSDEVRCVSGAAYEALETARRLLEKSPKCDRDVISITGSNFRNSNLRRRIPNEEDKSSSSISPESRTLGSFGGYGSLSESTPSESQVSCNFVDRKSGNRKLWSQQNGGVNISANGGLFSEIVDASEISHVFSEHDRASEINGTCINGFAALHGISSKDSLRSCSPSPQKVNSQINVDNVKIFTTPRKLVRSLQETDLKSATNQDLNPRTLCSCKCECDAMLNRHNQNGLSYETSDEEDKDSYDSSSTKPSHTDSESVSSTKDTPVSTEEQTSSKMVPASELLPRVAVKSFGRMVTGFLLQALFFGLFVAFVLVLWFARQEEDTHLVPT